MIDASGWRPLTRPHEGKEAFVASPFARLARAHAIASAGDTLVAIALAGTLFFSIDPNEARSKIFLYLALTMAPFAIVAPLVGPALDRASGGRRWVVIGSSLLRCAICAVMIDDVDSLLLFPEAFALLVVSKSYQVAKSALVPSTVRSDEELVEANSKLSLISGVVGFAAALPGALLLNFGGSGSVLALASLVFGAGVFVSWKIPKAQVASLPETQEAKEELRSVGVLLAASAMGLLRGVVGFLSFLLAFSLRTDGSPAWHFGVVLALSAIGGLAGAALAPVMRRYTTEERIITGLLFVVAVMGVAGAWLGDLAGAALLGGTVGLGAAAAKQAFDAIVQRDAPDANRGRSFARFEMRFQLIWVGGAVLGILPMPMWLGFLIVAGVAAFAAVSYTAGSRATSARTARRGARLAARSQAAATPAGETPTRDLPPSIVTPDGPATDPPEPLPPQAIPPGVAAPDATEILRPADPTVVEPGQGDR
jgi:hypothetical protein